MEAYAVRIYEKYVRKLWVNASSHEEALEIAERAARENEGELEYIETYHQSSENLETGSFRD